MGLETGPSYWGEEGEYMGLDRALYWGEVTLPYMGLETPGLKLGEVWLWYWGEEFGEKTGELTTLYWGEEM